MITFSNKIAGYLAKREISAFYIVDINGTNRFCTHYADIAFNGHTYTGNISLVSVDPPQMTTVVDRQQFKLGFSDPNMEFGSIAELGMVGQPVSIYIAFIDIDTGEPQLSLPDVILAYRGKIDGTAYGIETDEIGSSIFELTCSSPMGDLDAVKPMRATQDYMDKNFPGDSSFSQIYQGSGTLYLRWGKA